MLNLNDIGDFISKNTKKSVKKSFRKKILKFPDDKIIENESKMIEIIKKHSNLFPKLFFQYSIDEGHEQKNINVYMFKIDKEFFIIRNYIPAVIYNSVEKKNNLFCLKTNRDQALMFIDQYVFWERHIKFPKQKKNFSYYTDVIESFEEINNFFGNCSVSHFIDYLFFINKKIGEQNFSDDDKKKIYKMADKLIKKCLKN